MSVKLSYSCQNHARRINIVRQKWNNKSITSCLCAQTTLFLHAPAVTVKTESISKPTSSNFDSGKKSQG